jgi:fatty acid desaturase
MWPVRAAAWIVIALVIHGLAGLMHEAVHGLLCRSPLANRWAGFALALPALLGATAYRRIHLLHHRNNRTTQDPDDFARLSDDPRRLRSWFYAWLFIGCPIYVAHVATDGLRLSRGRERWIIVLEYGGIASIYLAALLLAFRTGRVDALLDVWAYPFLFVALFYGVRAHAEHQLTRPGHPLTETRTVVSNPVVSWFLCNTNYHLDHHLFPAVPWYGLPRLHTVLNPQYRAAGSHVHGSYARFLWDAIRLGVRGVAPDPGDAAPVSPRERI